MDFVTYRQHETYKNVVRLDDSDLIKGHSVAEVFSRIQFKSGGLERETLPLCLGGTFHYETMHTAWIFERLRIEWWLGKHFAPTRPLTTEGDESSCPPDEYKKERKSTAVSTERNHAPLRLHWVDYRRHLPSVVPRRVFKAGPEILNNK